MTHGSSIAGEAHECERGLKRTLFDVVFLHEPAAGTA